MGKQMDYRVAIDSRRVTDAYMSHFNLNGIPSAFVINKAGMVVWGGHPMDAGFEAALKQVNSEKSAAASVDLKKETSESLSHKPVRELREIAKGAGISLDGCVEKSEIVAKLKGQ